MGDDNKPVENRESLSAVMFMGMTLGIPTVLGLFAYAKYRTGREVLDLEELVAHEKDAISSGKLFEATSLMLDMFSGGLKTGIKSNPGLFTGYANIGEKQYRYLVLPNNSDRFRSVILYDLQDARKYILHIEK